MTDRTLQPGDLVVHPEFGPGKVTALYTDRPTLVWVHFRTMPMGKSRAVPVASLERSVIIERVPAETNIRPSSAALPDSRIGMSGSPIRQRSEHLQNLQRNIVGRRRLLRTAHESGRLDEVVRLKAELVGLRLAFCNRIRPRTQSQLEQLRDLLHHAVDRELTKLVRNDYRNICWVCQTDVMDSSNDQCSCHWLVCFADGACQCPDFWAGVKRDDPECLEQVQRLGADVYRWLVERRLGCPLETARNPARIRGLMAEQQRSMPIQPRAPFGAWDLDDVPF